MRVNPTEFAILGLLTEGPLSGYDIKKEVEGRLSHFWSESYGHIYPMLRRLLEQEYVDVALERTDGRPDRKVYSITDAGRRALEEWFAEPPAPHRPRNELLLRLFLGRHAPTNHLLRDVRHFREGAAHAIGQLRDVGARVDAEASAHPDIEYWRLTLRYGMKAFEALIEWADEAEAVLAAMNDAKQE